jgi:hypothetical protein
MLDKLNDMGHEAFIATFANSSKRQRRRASVNGAGNALLEFEDTITEMDPASRKVLSVVAAFGDAESEEVIEKILKLTSTATVDIGKCFKNLSSVNLVKKEGNGWTLYHNLIAEAVANCSNLETTHASIAKHLVDEEQMNIINPGRVARHLLAAKSNSRAREYLVSAGLTASEAGSNIEAVAFLEDAVKIQPQAKLDDVDEGRTYVALGVAQYVSGLPAGQYHTFFSSVAANSPTPPPRAWARTRRPPAL